MLEIVIPATEEFDEVNEVFIKTKEQTLLLEHSLISLSKWESKWKKAFFSKREKTQEETIDYIRCMTINKNVDKDIYYCLTKENVDKIYEYINDSMTAVYIFKDPSENQPSGDTVTSELIYYWMISFNIPFECQKWHVNKLMALIDVCRVKNAPKKKYSAKQLMSRNAAINEARRKKYNTRG